MNRQTNLSILKQQLHALRKDQLETVIFDLLESVSDQTLQELVSSMAQKDVPWAAPAEFAIDSSQSKWQNLDHCVVVLDVESSYGEDLMVDAPERIVLKDPDHFLDFVLQSQQRIHQAIDRSDANTGFALISQVFNAPVDFQFMGSPISTVRVMNLLKTNGYLPESFEELWLQLLPLYFMTSEEDAGQIMETVYQQAKDYGFGLNILRPVFQNPAFSMPERQTIARAWGKCLEEHQTEDHAPVEAALQEAYSYLPEKYSDLLAH